MIVYYHSKDNDGFACGYLFSLRHPEARIIGLDYGEKVLDTPEEDIIFADVTPPELPKAKSITIIDHHKTAFEKFNGKVDRYIYNVNNSACDLVWNFLYPTPPHPLIEYIEDADLWKWSLIHSREVSEALKSYPMSFECWEQRFNQPISKLMDEGSSILRYKEKLIQSALKSAHSIACGEHIFHAVQCPIPEITSELGNRLAEDGKIGAIYWWDGEKTQFGLRSKGDLDVSEVAKEFGGGGHKNAAGFSNPRKF